MLTGRKILFVHSSAGLYGADRCLLSIVKELSSRGAQSYIAIPCNGPLVEELKKAGAIVYFENTLVFRRDMFSIAGLIRLVMVTPKSVLRLAKIIKRERIDLVHTNTGVTMGGAFAAKLTQTPHIWHFREILSEFGLFFRFYELIVLLFSTRLIFITNAVKEQFTIKTIRGKGKVVYDGIPIQEYHVKTENNNERIKLTTVGLLAPYKGQDVLIKAMAIVAEHGIDFEAYIVGDVYGDRHSYRNSLKSLVASSGLNERVHFTGFLEDVRPYLERSNIFIMPSTRQEPLGIVMLEAMAAERAVIATSGGGTREIITDGEDGLLVPCGDSDKMAEAIIRLAENQDERHRLAKAGNEKVNKLFSESAAVDSILDLYVNTIHCNNKQMQDS